MTRKPLALIIMDGWGYRQEKEDNAIAQAHKPFFDSLLKDYPNTLIDASGPAVGLPEGIMGNSEVGHMNIGAGRIVYTGLSQIYQAIDNESFFENDALLSAIKTVQDKKSKLHLMGLVSDGSVHSHQDHLYALLKLAKLGGVEDVAIHCLMDGRDTSPNDGVKFLKELQNQIQEIGVGQIASVAGRYFTMDRDQNWDRVQKGFLAISGENKISESPVDYLESRYKEGEGDEFITPASFHGYDGFSENDAVIFFNFRADRAKQISRVFCDSEFSEFAVPESLPKTFVCMAPYDDSLEAPVAFKLNLPEKVFAEVISEKGLQQLRIAETEKYAHVTFFFNGGKNQVYPGEVRELIPSPKEVPTYDLKPEMSAPKVTEALIQKIQSQKFDVIICNYANTDMVGHTAVKDAVIKAVETVDDCLSKVIPEILKQGGEVLLTADHGNAETLVDDNGEPMTAHTTNLVPLIYVSEKNKDTSLKDGGRLCDLAPTLLQILGIDQPNEMTGKSLISV